LGLFGIRNNMTLKSALKDLKETTLGAVSGLLGKLAYLAALRREHGRYEHWGMEAVYGVESSQRALKTAHTEMLTGVLRAPLPSLLEDLDVSRNRSGLSSRLYVDWLRDHFEDLLPDSRQNSPASSHLNSVLLALSSLERNRERAIQSIS
jgi:hypothetical protein